MEKGTFLALPELELRTLIIQPVAAVICTELSLQTATVNCC
jgi:hypothetical protein